MAGSPSPERTTIVPPDVGEGACAPTEGGKIRSKRLGRPKPPGFGAKISAALKGRPKPWARGDGNPNFKNKAQSRPGVWEKFLASLKGRPGWSPAVRAAHAERMRGPSNAMRGRTHSPDALARMSAAKRRQYEDGSVRIRKYKLSIPERAIAVELRRLDHKILTQFHIPGVPFLYDFMLPDRRLIIEFNGDYWHANPARYRSGSILCYRGVPTLVDDVWRRDATKRASAEAAGYRFGCVWEADYKYRGMEAVLCLL